MPFFDKYPCQKCNKLFTSWLHCLNHEKKCNKQNSEVGNYTRYQTNFDSQRKFSESPNNGSNNSSSPNNPYQQ